MPKDITVNAYVLLDRSGSMANRWAEALTSINAYVEELAKKGKAKVTLATFDSQDGLQFDVLRDAVAAKKWEDVTDKDATPRGATPLFDAISRVVALAEKAAEDKTVIIVMTDGHENQSREVTREEAKLAFDRCKAKGWQIVFLGADFDAFGQAASVGINAAQTISATCDSFIPATRSLAMKTMLYASGHQAMAFSAQDRDEAVGKKKP